jgi:hypothetical protein
MQHIKAVLTRFARVRKARPSRLTRLMSQSLYIRDGWICQVDHALIALSLRNRCRWTYCESGAAVPIAKYFKRLAASFSILPWNHQQTPQASWSRSTFKSLVGTHTTSNPLRFKSTHNEDHRQPPRCRPDPRPRDRHTLTRFLKHQRQIPKISLV